MPQLIDFLRARECAARAERPAVQRRDRIRVDEHFLDVVVGSAEAAGRKGPTKDIAGPRAVDAVDLKPRRPDLPAVAPGQAPITSKGGADERGPELAADCAERAAQILVSGERARELPSSDDGVDVLQQVGNARPDFFDVDDRRDLRVAGVPGRARGGRGLMAVDHQDPARRDRIFWNIVDSHDERRITIPEHRAIAGASVDEDDGELVCRAHDDPRGAHVDAGGHQAFT